MATQVLGRFPTTLTVGIQYGALVLWPALFDGNHFRSFVYQVTLFGLGAAFLVELVLLKFQPSWGNMRWIRVHRAGLIAVVGAAVQLYGTTLGLGVYGFGVNAGLRQASHLTTLITPLSAWPAVGLTLSFYAWRHQPKDRRVIVTYAAITVTLSTVTAIISSSAANIYPLLVVAAVSAILAGVIKFRFVVGVIVILVLAWPTVYHFRNEGRVTKGATYYANLTAADAQARIEFDQYMANAKIAHDSRINISGLPSYWLVVRTGVVPRALDPHRPILQTSTLISGALDGNYLSSTTFTTFGELWFLYGYGGLVLITAAIAGLTGLLVRHRGPFAFVLLGAVIFSLLIPGAAFPDALAGILQYVVSASVAWIVVRPVALQSLRA